MTAVTLHLGGTVSARIEGDRSSGEWFDIGRLEFDLLHGVSPAPFTQSPKMVSGVAP